MPVVRKKMAALRSEYGSKKGESVYYAMEKQAAAQSKKGRKKSSSKTKRKY